jgi:hypothetical protein
MPLAPHTATTPPPLQRRNGSKRFTKDIKQCKSMLFCEFEVLTGFEDSISK